MHVCLYWAMCPRVQVPEETRGMGSPGAGVICSCELPNMGAGNWPWVLCKSSSHSFLTTKPSSLQYLKAYIFKRCGNGVLPNIHKALAPRPCLKKKCEGMQLSDRAVIFYVWGLSSHPQHNNKTPTTLGQVIPHSPQSFPMLNHKPILPLQVKQIVV